jgi:hypothetical protein
MTERWVCKRCFSSNDGDAGACTTCGLARGSEVPAGEQLAPAAQPSASPWSWVLRFWWVGLIVLVLVGGAAFSARRGDGGEIVGAGDLDVFQLKVGDCFDLEDEEVDSISQVEAKPCTEPHEFEIFHEASLRDGGFPTDAEIDALLEAECLPEFWRFIGVPYAQSRYYIESLAPSPETWAEGDRVVQCMVYDPANPDLTSSLRGANR